MTLDQFQHIHCIGIGGIGLSALAKLLRHEGKTVTGSDVNSEAKKELSSAGIIVATGHVKENIPASAELIIYSDAVPADNPERVAATERNIPQISYFEALGLLSKNYKTLAVSGTHGKSTTTALLGLFLEAAGFDPLVIVGSRVRTFAEGNLRMGKGGWFVVEACEHKANMVKIEAHGVIITSIEPDHLDFYRDLADIQEHFVRFAEKSTGGPVMVNADDPNSSVLADAPRRVTFGLHSAADYHAANIKIASGIQHFSLVARGTTIGTLEAHIPGRFNIANIVAAASMALEIGVPFPAIQKVVSIFTGIWRRFEKVGEWHGATIISDYGHHPTAIRETVHGAREFYPGQRIVLIFQPHQHNRTKMLFNDFITSFDGADVLILNEIFDVAGREEAHDQGVSSRALSLHVAERIGGPGVSLKAVEYAANFDHVQRVLERAVQPRDIIIIMGAGDIYKVAEELANN